MNELLEFKQTGLVEDYTTKFQALRYGVTMHDASYGEMFFTQQYIIGLKEEIRPMVEGQMPTTVLQASTLARVQQKLQDKSKNKHHKAPYQYKPYQPNKAEAKPTNTSSQLWQDRQLRDYRKDNGLCYDCGEKFVPGHMQVYTKRNKPAANALVLNDLDRDLSDEVLNALATEDVLQEEFGELSLNAMSSIDNIDCIKIKARVKDKVMLILLDSGSTHSFISSKFVDLIKAPTIQIAPKRVTLADGKTLITNRMVSQLHCYCQ